MDSEPVIRTQQGFFEKYNTQTARIEFLHDAGILTDWFYRAFDGNVVVTLDSDHLDNDGEIVEPAASLLSELHARLTDVGVFLTVQNAERF